MVFVPKWPFFHTFFFQARQARKMSFTRFQNEKTPFQAIKTRSLKSRKIDIFLKGLTHGFGLKMAAYPTFFFFKEYWPGKCRLRFSTSKKTSLQPMKTKSLKSRKTVIFPRGLTHSFGPKFAIFPTVFLGNIGQENVFYDIVDRKNAFVTYKNKKSKKSKN